MKERKLYRSCADRYVAGVCGGLAEYFDLDPLLVRLVFAILAIPGVSIVFYILAWILIPNNPTCHGTKNGAEEIRSRAEEIGKIFKEGISREKFRNDSGKTRTIIGGMIILIGILSLLEIIFKINVWALSWPAGLIIIGLLILKAGTKRRE